MLLYYIGVGVFKTYFGFDLSLFKEGGVAMAIGINTGSGYNSYLSQNSRSTDVSERAVRQDGISRPAGIEKAESGEVKPAEREVRREPLENQVAESVDGDTLQISPDSASKLDESLQDVRTEEKTDTDNKDTVARENTEKAELKEQENRIREREAELKYAEQKKEVQREESRRELLDKIISEGYEMTNASEAAEQISFAGKSDSEIARLYLKGEISKSDYDSVIAERDRLREQLERNNDEFVDAVSEGNAKEDRMERFGNNLRTAFSDRASEKFDAVTRLETIEAAEGSKAAEKEREKPGRKEAKITYN